ncbi:phosphoesterase RecJ domain-containing protein [Bryocella elongata]|uniref:Phosphoesterase RecJ domain-containing protein n=1 Tax=Bryocella elongata TaxID=863522 RepID=A0A1H5WES9_9BACT|nr:bifunctional oligoribonuclease/PAP phosphatase NrnA [Bryocella elongata]SEF97878.1 phosphoesterase RecJ domain-containing protein [Bryocella elongata]
MTNESAIAELQRIIARHQSFFITSHARPDGDAIGTSLAVMHLLDALGKHSVVAFADAIPNTYLTLPGVERIVHALPSAAPEVAVILECDSVERTGFDPRSFAAMRPGMVVNIDHHQSGRDYADFNWIDMKACAVAAMIYDLTLAMGIPITCAMATCLYTAVLTDTAAFTHAGTMASTFSLAEHLIQCGADPNGIAQQVYHSNSVGKIRLLGSALSNMQIDGEVAWTLVTEDEMRQAGAQVEDCEGVVNYLIGIAGVRAAAFLREVALPDNDRHYRLSLRSKGEIDVARVAEELGGGGHRNASGCTLEGPADRATARIVAALQAACPSVRSTLLA